MTPSSDSSRRPGPTSIRPASGMGTQPLAGCDSPLSPGGPDDLKQLAHSNLATGRGNIDVSPILPWVCRINPRRCLDRHINKTLALGGGVRRGTTVIDLKAIQITPGATKRIRPSQRRWIRRPKAYCRLLRTGWDALKQQVDSVLFPVDTNPNTRPPLCQTAWRLLSPAVMKRTGAANQFPLSH